MWLNEWVEQRNDLPLVDVIGRLGSLGVQLDPDVKGEVCPAPGPLVDVRTGKKLCHISVGGMHLGPETSGPDGGSPH